MEDDDDDDVVCTFVVGTGRITPFNTINKNKRIKKIERISDDDIMEEFDAYYLKLSKRSNCYHYNNRSAARDCNCCTMLENDILRKGVASYAFNFGNMKRDERIKVLRMWYRYANVESITTSALKYLLPFDITDKAFPEDVDGIKICSGTLIDILGLGRRVWTEVARGHRLGREISSHGLRGLKSNRKIKDHDEVIISLHANFKILKCYGEVEVMRFLREKTGEVTERDGADDVLYLPTSMTKRSYHRQINPWGGG